MMCDVSWAISCLALLLILPGSSAVDIPHQYDKPIVLHPTEDLEVVLPKDCLEACDDNGCLIFCPEPARAVKRCAPKLSASLPALPASLASRRCCSTNGPLSPIINIPPRDAGEEPPSNMVLNKPLSAPARLNPTLKSRLEEVKKTLSKLKENALAKRKNLNLRGSLATQCDSDAALQGNSGSGMPNNRQPNAEDTPEEVTLKANEGGSTHPDMFDFAPAKVNTAKAFEGPSKVDLLSDVQDEDNSEDGTIESSADEKSALLGTDARDMERSNHVEKLSRINEDTVGDGIVPLFNGNAFAKALSELSDNQVPVTSHPIEQKLQLEGEEKLEEKTTDVEKVPETVQLYLDTDTKSNPRDAIDSYNGHGVPNVDEHLPPYDVAFDRGDEPADENERLWKDYMLPHREENVGEIKIVEEHPRMEGNDDSGTIAHVEHGSTFSGTDYILPIDQESINIVKPKSDLPVEELLGVHGGYLNSQNIHEDSSDDKTLQKNIYGVSKSSLLPGEVTDEGHLKLQQVPTSTELDEFPLDQKTSQDDTQIKPGFEEPHGTQNQLVQENNGSGRMAGESHLQLESYETHASSEEFVPGDSDGRKIDSLMQMREKSISNGFENNSGHTADEFNGSESNVPTSQYETEQGKEEAPNEVQTNEKMMYGEKLIQSSQANNLNFEGPIDGRKSPLVNFDDSSQNEGNPKTTTEGKFAHHLTNEQSEGVLSKNVGQNFETTEKIINEPDIEEEESLRTGIEGQFEGRKLQNPKQMSETLLNEDDEEPKITPNKEFNEYRSQEVEGHTFLNNHLDGKTGELVASNKGILSQGMQNGIEEQSQSHMLFKEDVHKPMIEQDNSPSKILLSEEVEEPTRPEGIKEDIRALEFRSQEAEENSSSAMDFNGETPASASNEGSNEFRSQEIAEGNPRSNEGFKENIGTPEFRPQGEAEENSLLAMDVNGEKPARASNEGSNEFRSREMAEGNPTSNEELKENIGTPEFRSQGEAEENSLSTKRIEEFREPIRATNEGFKDYRSQKIIEENSPSNEGITEDIRASEFRSQGEAEVNSLSAMDFNVKNSARASNEGSNEFRSQEIAEGNAQSNEGFKENIVTPEFRSQGEAEENSLSAKRIEDFREPMRATNKGFKEYISQEIAEEKRPITEEIEEDIETPGYLSKGSAAGNSLSLTDFKDDKPSRASNEESEGYKSTEVVGEDTPSNEEFKEDIGAPGFRSQDTEGNSISTKHFEEPMRTTNEGSKEHRSQEIAEGKRPTTEEFEEDIGSPEFRSQGVSEGNPVFETLNEPLRTTNEGFKDYRSQEIIEENSPSNEGLKEGSLSQSFSSQDSEGNSLSTKHFEDIEEPMRANEGSKEYRSQEIAEGNPPSNFEEELDHTGANIKKMEETIRKSNEEFKQDIEAPGFRSQDTEGNSLSFKHFGDIEEPMRATNEGSKDYRSQDIVEENPPSNLQIEEDLDHTGDNINEMEETIRKSNKEFKENIGAPGFRSQDTEGNSFPIKHIEDIEEPMMATNEGSKDYRSQDIAEGNPPSNLQVEENLDHTGDKIKEMEEPIRNTNDEFKMVGSLEENLEHVQENMVREGETSIRTTNDDFNEQTKEYLPDVPYIADNSFIQNALGHPKVDNEISSESEASPPKMPLRTSNGIEHCVNNPKMLEQPAVTASYDDHHHGTNIKVTLQGNNHAQHFSNLAHALDSVTHLPRIHRASITPENQNGQENNYEEFLFEDDDPEKRKSLIPLSQIIESDDQNYLKNIEDISIGDDLNETLNKKINEDKIENKASYKGIIDFMHKMTKLDDKIDNYLKNKKPDFHPSGRNEENKSFPIDFSENKFNLNSRTPVTLSHQTLPFSTLAEEKLTPELLSDSHSSQYDFLDVNKDRKEEMEGYPLKQSYPLSGRDETGVLSAEVTSRVVNINDKSSRNYEEYPMKEENNGLIEHKTLMQDAPFFNAPMALVSKIDDEEESDKNSDQVQTKEKTSFETIRNNDTDYYPRSSSDETIMEFYSNPPEIHTQPLPSELADILLEDHVSTNEALPSESSTNKILEVDDNVGSLDRNLRQEHAPGKFEGTQENIDDSSIDDRKNDINIVRDPDFNCTAYERTEVPLDSHTQHLNALQADKVFYDQDKMVPQAKTTSHKKLEAFGSTHDEKTTRQMLPHDYIKNKASLPFVLNHDHVYSDEEDNFSIIDDDVKPDHISQDNLMDKENQVVGYMANLTDGNPGKSIADLLLKRDINSLDDLTGFIQDGAESIPSYVVGAEEVNETYIQNLLTNSKDPVANIVGIVNNGIVDTSSNNLPELDEMASITNPGIRKSKLILDPTKTADVLKLVKNLNVSSQAEEPYNPQPFRTAVNVFPVVINYLRRIERNPETGGPAYSKGSGENETVYPFWERSENAFGPDHQRRTLEEIESEDDNDVEESASEIPHDDSSQSVEEGVTVSPVVNVEGVIKTQDDLTANVFPPTQIPHDDSPYSVEERPVVVEGTIKVQDVLPPTLIPLDGSPYSVEESPVANVVEGTIKMQDDDQTANVLPPTQIPLDDSPYSVEERPVANVLPPTEVPIEDSQILKKKPDLIVAIPDGDSAKEEIPDHVVDLVDDLESGVKSVDVSDVNESLEQKNNEKHECSCSHKSSVSPKNPINALPPYMNPMFNGYPGYPYPPIYVVVGDKKPQPIPARNYYQEDYDPDDLWSHLLYQRNVKNEGPTYEFVNGQYVRIRAAKTDPAPKNQEPKSAEDEKITTKSSKDPLEFLSEKEKDSKKDSGSLIDLSEKPIPPSGTDEPVMKPVPGLNPEFYNPVPIYIYVQTKKR